MKRLKSMVILFLCIMLTACEPISQTLPENTEYYSNDSYEEIDDISSNLTAEEETTEEETVSYTEYVAEVPEIIATETDSFIEAEKCEFGGSLYVSDNRKGFSGEGYVTGFYGGSADDMNITAELDVNQHYDITICVASDYDVKTQIEINDNSLQEFTISGEEGFTKITFYGIYMDKGKNVIKIKSGNENFDLDYIEITNSNMMYEMDFELSENATNENSSDETELLLNFMKESFGDKIITGQYVSSNENKELELIHEITGKYPAIRFGDIAGYSNNAEVSSGEIDAAVEWAEKGGIVGFMWYWNSPDKESPSVYADKTDFSLSAAMPKKDIAQLPISEIENMYKEGLVTFECLELVKNIDEVSKAFLILAQKDIPVLWRPLHEAGGGWFWWGADGPDAYKWLYNLMYERMTKYHKLDNLIWIWNGQSKDYLVDCEHYDIAAMDVYLPPQEKYGGRSEQYLWLKSITDSGKLLALSECSSVPSIDDMLRDKSLWSFFGLWFGDYIMNKNGDVSEIYTKKSEFIKIYNAENAITLENYAGAYTDR